jgi:ribosome-associated protein
METKKRLSKSERKRQAQRAQTLGATLVALKPSQRASVEITPELSEAINEYQQLSNFKARRRQIQFIGRLIRNEDQDAIAKSIEHATTFTAQEKSLNRNLENLRDRLIANREALTNYVREHPDADVRALRDTIWQVRKSADPDTRTKFARHLFRMLRDSHQSERKPREQLDEQSNQP